MPFQEPTIFDQNSAKGQKEWEIFKKEHPALPDADKILEFLSLSRGISISKEKLKSYIDEIDNFISFQAVGLSTVAPIKGVGFELALDGYSFSHVDKTIFLGLAEWIELREKGSDLEVVSWSIVHELGHYIDLLNDPEGYLAQLEEAKKTSKELAPEFYKIWEEAISQKGETPSDEITVDTVQNWIMKKIYNEFDNSLNDIYVNVLAANSVPKYGEGHSKEKITELYRKTLFPIEQPTKGYADIPLGAQLSYKLLRDKMVSEEPCVVSRKVQEILEKIVFRGKTVQESVYMIENPGINPNSPLRKISYRDQLIKLIGLRDIYIDFLREDIKKMPAKIEKGGESQPGSGGGDGWSDIPDKQPVSEKDIKEAKKTRDESDQEGEKDSQEDKDEDESEDDKDGKTPEDRLKESRERIIQNDLLNQGLDELKSRILAKEWVEIGDKVSGHIQKLADTFKKILRSIDEKIATTVVYGQKPGVFDIKRAVKHPHIFATEDLSKIEDLPLYRRKEYEHRIGLRPSKIMIRLLLDISGSMDRGGKIDALKEMLVIVTDAIKQFEADVIKKFPTIKGEKSFIVNIDLYLYNSKLYHPVKASYLSPKKISMTRAEILKAFSLIKPASATRSDLAWQEIQQTVNGDKKWQKMLANGNARDITIEITDGSPTCGNPLIIQDYVKSLRAAGAECFALQVPGANKNDVASFKEIWNDIGGGVSADENPDLESIVDEFTVLLKRNFEKIKFDVFLETEDDIINEGEEQDLP